MAKAYNVFEKVSFEGAASKFVGRIDEVNGWLSRHEAAIFMLIDEVQKSKRVEGYLAELGVWHGRGVVLLCFLRRSHEDVYAIDIFNLREPEHSHYNDPKILLDNLEKQKAGRVEFLEIDTAETPELLLKSLPSVGCRIFHVDGGHEYKSVRNDMGFAASVLTEGGVLVCDDVFAKKFPGVTQALIETLTERHQLAPFAISSKKVWITTRGFVDKYRRHITSRCPGAHFRRSEFMGEQVLIMP